ncbi:hypothetical protein ACGFIV_03665 [Sphaerisporangium sp. NPDC049003]|uniref:hypothetical protein n=1 Tax=Sphaerisporangium sp. NPDC049003 TaxID=3364517 RepID=UPI00371B3427
MLSELLQIADWHHRIRTLALQPRMSWCSPWPPWPSQEFYAGIAGDLVLWELVEELSGTVESVASLGVWAATVILLVRVVSGVSARFRAFALALGLISVLTPPLGFFIDGSGFQAFSLLGLASVGWTVMILIGQRHDGRWSSATINIGRIALVAPLAVPLLRLALQDERMMFDGTGLAMRALGDEESARLGFTGADEGCRERIRSSTDTRQEDRRRAFLCVARDDTERGTPIFPKDLADQRVLVYGEELCAVPGVKERQALLLRAGGSADAAELGGALEFLCPGIVARQRAEQARKQAERERETAAWKAEMNARCANPWPKLRARRQGTAAYRLFEGGGYGVHDARDSAEGAGGDIFAAIEDGFIDAAGSSVAITTYGENEPMCLTVKAFGAAPPLRLKGWDRVVEVGVVSRSGRLVVPSYAPSAQAGEEERRVS